MADASPFMLILYVLILILVEQLLLWRYIRYMLGCNDYGCRSSNLSPLVRRKDIAQLPWCLSFMRFWKWFFMLPASRETL